MSKAYVERGDHQWCAVTGYPQVMHTFNNQAIFEWEYVLLPEDEKEMWTEEMVTLYE